MIASFAKTCTFSIEIEIMYWMYWGGYLCVFGTAPCSIRLGSAIEWVKVDWRTAFLFTTHALMYYHGIWFNWYAYDQVFSRVPCGTYHFFLVPLLDPSEVFWALRDCLNHLLIPLIPLLTLFPFIGLILIPEIKHAVQDSPTYQFFFPKPANLDHNQADFTEPNDTSASQSIALRVYRRLHRSIKWIYIRFRKSCDLPSRRRGGIRLVTPVNVKDRKFVEFPYLRVSSFVAVCWSLMQQESNRRRELKCRQSIKQSKDGIELNTLTHTFADAFSHAFAQPDIGVSTSRGALPNNIPAEEGEIASQSSAFIQKRSNEFMMSGALDVHPDLEAQKPANEGDAFPYTHPRRLNGAQNKQAEKVVLVLLVEQMRWRR
ncbi:MAG: hypothetical protein Q9168_006404 [Polycauliona sp. 1 TL-2023]